MVLFPSSKSSSSFETLGESLASVMHGYNRSCGLIVKLPLTTKCGQLVPFRCFHSVARDLGVNSTAQLACPKPFWEDVLHSPSPGGFPNPSWGQSIVSALSSFHWCGVQWRIGQGGPLRGLTLCPSPMRWDEPYLFQTSRRSSSWSGQEAMQLGVAVCSCQDLTFVC